MNLLFKLFLMQKDINYYWLLHIFVLIAIVWITNIFIYSYILTHLMV